MKATKFYIDRKFLAEKLGVDESSLVIGDVESNFDSIEFTVFIDSDAKVSEGVEIVEGLNLIRRKKLS